MYLLQKYHFNCNSCMRNNLLHQPLPGQINDLKNNTLHVVINFIYLAISGVDLHNNFCNNKNPHHLGSALYARVFFFIQYSFN